MSNKPLNTEPPPDSPQGSSLTRFQRGGGVSLLLILSLPAAGFAAPGDLDPSFDGDGRVLTDFGGFDRPFDVVRQPDGKLVAAGFSNSGGGPVFALARYRPDGSLDTGFGNGGIVRDVVGGFAFSSSLVLQADGKLVAGGTSANLATFDL